MQQGVGRGGELPRCDVKGQAFGGAERWEPSPGPRCSARSPLQVPTQPPPAGSPVPASRLVFNLLQKLKLHCMYCTASAKVNKFRDDLFFQAFTVKRR